MSDFHSQSLKGSVLAIRLLWGSFFILVIAILAVGATTYEAETVIGTVLDVEKVHDLTDKHYHVHIDLLQQDEVIDIELKNGQECPVGSQVVLYQKQSKLLGNVSYEYVSCEVSY